MNQLSPGDICTVSPHDQEWAGVYAIIVNEEDSVTLVPRDSIVLVTQVLMNRFGTTDWCRALHDGIHVEIGTDVLRLVQ